MFSVIFIAHGNCVSFHGTGSSFPLRQRTSTVEVISLLTAGLTTSEVPASTELSHSVQTHHATPWDDHTSAVQGASHGGDMGTDLDQEEVNCQATLVGWKVNP